MDNGDERVYQYGLDHPDNVKAIIPVSFGGVPEFTSHKDFYGWSEEEALRNARMMLRMRMGAG